MQSVGWFNKKLQPIQLYSHAGNHLPVWLSFPTILLSPLIGVTTYQEQAIYFSRYDILVLTFHKKELWSNQKLTSQRTSLHFWPFGCRNCPKTMSRERCQHSQFEPRTKLSLWPMIAIPEDWPFWKKQLVLQNDFVQVLESYTTVCPIE